MRALAILVALTGCTNLRSADSAPEAIAVEVTSWGRPVSRWSIAADGRGMRMDSEPLARDALHTYARVTREFTVTPEGFAAVRADLRAFEDGRAIPCTTIVTDQPAGTLRWTFAEGDRTVAFNLGCRSPEADRLHAALRTARDRIEALAKTGTVTDRKVLPQNHY